MKKILITGENSYIGTSFNTYMEKFADDYSIDTVSTFGDAWEKIDFSKYDVLLHVAGIAHVSSDPNQKDLYYKINRDLTIKIANYAKSAGVNQFIFMSSIIVYGSKNTTISFNTIPTPDNFYGKSKLEADVAIQNLNSDTFSVASIRPPMIYGKNSKGNFPRLVKLAKITSIFPDYKNQRSMLYIDNLLECIRLIIDNQTCGYIYPQNAEYVCTSDLVKTIRALQGKKTHLTPLFNFIIKSLSNHVGIFNKVFGDLCYDKKMSGYNEFNYQTQTFENSIKLTESYE